MRLARLVDSALDRTVVPGFSVIGYRVRKRLPTWPRDPGADCLTGKTALVTGASSGLGTATAEGLARLGARVGLVVRDVEKGERVAARLRAQAPGATYDVHRCDLADLDDVRRFVAEYDAAVDVLVHNAGALPSSRETSPQQHELTMAVHLLGPLALTEGLLPAMSGRNARVVLVTSGGMYGQRLRADDPEYLQAGYSGTTAYARSKRAQVELLPALAARWGEAGVVLGATHPGWADTPGVAQSLPTFRRVMGPVLRDPDAGADTTVWFAGTLPAPATGLLWHDRRPRATHLRRDTRSPAEQVDQMWTWAFTAAGIED